ncbi:MAG TPA: RsmG family class I SAM-dependent methyltransferase [Elusimicrobiota bacterium]|nr:RsmG family class I SAM-dependent methyltransferase [Elusimicrobiota bacterium]
MNAPAPLEILESAARELGSPLSAAQLNLFRLYLDFLLERGAATNLTADLEPEKILLRHFADGLAAARALDEFAPQPEPKVADVGSGAGFVGVALKIARPEILMTLIEPSQKRFDFLNLLILKLGLKGLRLARKKMPQDCGTLSGTFDLVLERALAPLPDALSLCWPLAKTGGFVAAYQSDPADRADKALSRRLDLLSARLVKSLPYRLRGETRDRHLALFEKPAQEMN